MTDDPHAPPTNITPPQSHHSNAVASSSSTSSRNHVDADELLRKHKASFAKSQTSYPPLHSHAPFKAADNRPQEHDGVCRVVVVAAGCEASRFIPAIVGALTKDPTIAVQIVASAESLRFMDQHAVDDAVRSSWNLASGSEAQWGVRVWTDADEWAGWTQPGDSVLHRELRKWTDLVVVAPCSADMMAKMASGLSENAALSLLRSLPSSTPVMVCPAMNCDMFANAFTLKHLTALRDELHYVVVGPETKKTGEGRGAMADWRDIVIAIQDMASLFHMRQQQLALLGDAVMSDDENAVHLPPPRNPNDPVPTGNVPEATDEVELARKLGHPFSIWRPVWGELNLPPSMESVQAAYFPIPGLPMSRTEHERCAERHNADSADPTIVPTLHASFGAVGVASAFRQWQQDQLLEGHQVHEDGRELRWP